MSLLCSSRVYAYAFLFCVFISALLLNQGLRNITISSLITIYVPLPNIVRSNEYSLSNEQMEVREALIKKNIMEFSIIGLTPPFGHNYGKIFPFIPFNVSLCLESGKNHGVEKISFRPSV